MSSNITKSLTTFLIVTFALWYFMRRTSLGSGYSRDMWNLPQQLGIMEGLRSVHESYTQ